MRRLVTHCRLRIFAGVGAERLPLVCYAGFFFCGYQNAWDSSAGALWQQLIGRQREACAAELH